MCGIVKMVSAKILEGDHVRKKRSIFECKMDDTIADLYSKCAENDENDGRPISKRTVNIYSSKDTKDKYSISLNAPVSIINDFCANSVTFQFEKSQNSQSVATNKDAFRLLMARSKQLDLPKRRQGNNATDKIYNDILDILRKEKVGWSVTIVETVGGKFVKLFMATLWHITSHFDYFSGRGAKLPVVFEDFSNRNEYKKQQMAKPILSSQKLDKFTNSLADILNCPWMNSRSFAVIRSSVSALNISLCKVNEYMQSQKEKVATRRKSQEPARISTEYTSMNHIAANLGPVRSECSDVLSALEIKEEYEPIVLCDYEPENRRRRSEWLQGLCLPFSLILLRRAYGGNIGTMNFLWKIPLDKNRRDGIIEMRLVLKLNKNLPNFHSRQMEKDFIQRYTRIAKTPISVLRNIYKEISGDCSEYNTQGEKDTSLRIATFISQCDNTDILIDLRKLNGKPNNSLYDEFWEEIHILFNECQAAAQERRHWCVIPAIRYQYTEIS